MSEQAEWTPAGNVDGAELFVRFEQSQLGLQVITGVMLVGSVIRADQLRQVPIAALTLSRNHGTPEARDLPPLRRDPAMGPKEFSRLVAGHYRRWAAVVPTPAVALAREFGVKAPTMASWIREARLRGFLPPAAPRRQRGAA
jgi:hypothetical protein